MVPTPVPSTEMIANKLREKLLREKTKASRRASASEKWIAAQQMGRVKTSTFFTVCSATLSDVVRVTYTHK
jgi:hypothetical protein